MGPNSQNQIPPNQPTAPPIPGANDGAIDPARMKRNKIIVVAMIVGILLIVPILFFTIRGSNKDPAVEGIESIIAHSAEISRVSTLAIESELLSGNGYNLAATANVTAKSNGAVASRIIAEVYKSEVSKDVLASSFNSQNDDALKQGELLDRMDASYGDLLKELLIQSNNIIQAATTENNQAVNAQLAIMAESNETLFNSIR